MTKLATASILRTTDGVLTDEDIARRVVAGEHALFEVLMRRYNQRVYRAVRAVLRNDSDVEDAMQQAYLSVLSHLDQFEGRARLSTWLLRIAVNEALARVRRQHRTRALDDEMELHERSMHPTISAIHDPEHRAATHEIVAILETAVDRLPQSNRIVFMLRDIEGLDTAEVAETLEVSEDVVKTRLHRARTQLRAEMQTHLGPDLTAAFPFGNTHCDRFVEKMLTFFQTQPTAPV